MANDKRIGDLAIILIILSFVVSTLSGLLVSFDNSLNHNSYSSYHFKNLSATTNSYSSQLETSFTDVTDGADKLAVDKDQFVDTRFDSGSGFINLISKNLFVKFFRSITNSLPGAVFIFTFLLSLITTFITILIIRFFKGSDKI